MVGRRGRARVTMLGVSAAYQNKISSEAEGSKRGAQGNVDLSFNGDGYQAVLAVSATYDEPQSGAAYTNYGAMAQAGYFVADRHQVYSQYNFLSPGDERGDLENFHSVLVGYNFFPFLWTNRWKFSAELGHLFSALNRTVVAPSGALGLLPSDERDQTFFRIQFQVGF